MLPTKGPSIGRRVQCHVKMSLSSGAATAVGSGFLDRIKWSRMSRFTERSKDVEVEKLITIVELFFSCRFEEPERQDEGALEKFPIVPLLSILEALVSCRNIPPRRGTKRERMKN